MAQKPRETDVRRRTGMSTGLLQPGGSSSGGAGAASSGSGPNAAKGGADATQSADEFLQQTEDELNNRVDGSVVGLADGFLELIKLASNKNKNAFTSSEEAFQMDIRVQNIIRQTQNLMSLSHTLKLLLLTADATSPERDRQLQELSQQSSVQSKEALEHLNEIIQNQQVPRVNGDQAG